MEKVGVIVCWFFFLKSLSFECIHLYIFRSIHSCPPRGRVIDVPELRQPQAAKGVVDQEPFGFSVRWRKVV